MSDTKTAAEYNWSATEWASQVSSITWDNPEKTVAFIDRILEQGRREGAEEERQRTFDAIVEYHAEPTNLSISESVIVQGLKNQAQWQCENLHKLEVIMEKRATEARVK